MSTYIPPASSSNEPSSRFAFWNFSEPYEFIPSQVSQPKCAPTEDIFGNLIGYSEFVHPSRQEEDDNEATAGHYDTDVPSPLKKQQRRKLRESAGVKGTSSRNPGRSAAGPLPNPKPETSLPPAGRMQCLWGDGCPTKMDFDYTPETIEEWKDHIASHLAESSEPTEDSGGGARPRAKRVECSWNGCGTRVERERLFKHIAAHEVRLKLLCSNRCGVNIRDDNLERHLKSCRLRQRGRI